MIVHMGKTTAQKKWRPCRQKWNMNSYATAVGDTPKAYFLGPGHRWPLFMLIVQSRRSAERMSTSPVQEPQEPALESPESQEPKGRQSEAKQIRFEVAKTSRSFEAK